MNIENKGMVLLIDARNNIAKAVGNRNNVSNIELAGIYELLSQDEFNKQRRVSKVALYVKFDNNDGFFVHQNTIKGDIILARIYEQLKRDIISKINQKFIIREGKDE